jgi:hypothetical protein
MGPRKITLRRDEHCVVCARNLSARSHAWWDDVARTVTCLTCATKPASVGHDARPNPVRTISGDARPSNTWMSNAADAARLSARLRTDLAGRAVVLDDRRVPPTKSNIDHLVIAPSGVWIVGAKHHTGKVVHRDIGSFLRTETRLFVDGHDRTALVAGLDCQVTAVRHALAVAGIDNVPVRPVLCFTSSEWGLLAKPFTINGVLITWATKLSQRILDGPPAHHSEPMHLAAVLGAALPAAR